MHVESRITFRSEDESEADQILRPVDGGASKDTLIHSVTLDIDSDKYECLVASLSERGITFNEYRDWVFEEEELQAAEFLELSAIGNWGFPQPEDSYRLDVYDSSSGCRICGTGLVQKRPFSVKGKPKFGRNDIMAMNWTYELLVNESLHRLLIDGGFSGMRFMPLIDDSRKLPIEGYYQMAIAHELPPLPADCGLRSPIAADDVLHRACAKHLKMLGRESEYGPVSLLRLPRSSVENAMDFNRTHEYLSEGFDAHQWKVVSQKVRRAFIDNDVKGAKFQPVIIHG